MSTVALMWEARAAAGRGNELLEWARSQVLEREPVRRELLRAQQDRVLVVTWWEAAEGVAAQLPELPEPADDLITRPVHRWRFESVETSGT
ncbi:hypothetical protein OG311_22750 [Streptomyces sp. NBC_01343]|uniref:hypothetical protein n=1 Tax=Streptomyces sp. NBC_01343 TaxID=2903832 RepID=UPI002E0D58DB|nr:hypothetical protein OG311_22750 [Streptomyces sp. NBC_01343]